jgi:phage terminase large subunit-like protein
MSKEEDRVLRERLAVLEAEARQRRYNQLAEFQPHPPQAEFIALGATKRERAFIASNQSGKSHVGAIETAAHLTGRYPNSWNGRRFDRPVRMWSCGVSGMAVRDTPQVKLFGPVGTEPGSGLLPKDLVIGKPTSSHGVAEAYDTARVKHISGGISTLTFKSYEQGMLKFAGEGVDAIHLDEICPMAIYHECLARISLTSGMIYATFTPLDGWTPLSTRYLLEPSPQRAVVQTDLYRCGLYTKERADEIRDTYPENERAARVFGQVSLFEGAVFAGVLEDQIREPTLAYVPPEWAKIWGIDFGIGHPFAAVLLAWDRETDTMHVLHCIRVTDQLPYQHAALMKPIGSGVPVSWPHDGHIRDRNSGEPLSKSYSAHGLRMLEAHATHADGKSISTEAGILEIYERMKTGRFKVAAHCTNWFEEFRGYCRKDNQIVKFKDDLMSATRMAVTARRFAKAVPLGPNAARGRNSGAPAPIADGVDFDPFNPQVGRSSNVQVAKGVDDDPFTW